MLRLIKRNLLLFFRDKENVFFSLLSVLIVFALYFLFLGEMFANGLNEVLEAEHRGGARAIIGALFMAGSIAVVSVTSSLGAIGVMIEDKEKALKDLTVSPLQQSKITLSYIISSAIVGLIMTTLMIVVVSVYLAIRGVGFIGFNGIGMLILTTVLSVLCANAVIFFIILFIKSRAAFNGLSTVMGAGVGFFMGVYIFIGQMPSAVQWVIKLFPFSHSASMYRQIFADSELIRLAASDPQQLNSLRSLYGIVFNYGSFTSTFWFSAGILLATTVLFLCLSILVQKTRKAK
jgi:multidrug/hemolysin transport system permease protein